MNTIGEICVFSSGTTVKGKKKKSGSPGPLLAKSRRTTTKDQHTHHNSTKSIQHTNHLFSLFIRRLLRLTPFNDATKYLYRTFLSPATGHQFAIPAVLPHPAMGRDPSEQAAGIEAGDTLTLTFIVKQRIFEV
ncbi:hypothetical protein JWG42_13795 [Desulfoprunum benzoelyticum]|uniref:Uncharacterized protein n=1 Tax=Desulfoprunum benzoelyticum TaxID=1506996 RepID=A0A840V008_9BACT|nr:hypothetical protein [Desulfoprunum benzoelyticum]MBB5347140.1 hypothetical protein [Desulfoprunum benzoelyticum]MBM9531227.1 hypothetical protein [Desulfoprunum benzoelyticum]